MQFFVLWLVESQQRLSLIVLLAEKKFCVLRLTLLEAKKRLFATWFAKQTFCKVRRET
jgi:hypothetical protein